MRLRDGSDWARTRDLRRDGPSRGQDRRRRSLMARRLGSASTARCPKPERAAAMCPSLQRKTLWCAPEKPGAVCQDIPTPVARSRVYVDRTGLWVDKSSVVLGARMVRTRTRSRRAHPECTRAPRRWLGLSNVVVLPQPLGSRRTRNSPGLISRARSSMAVAGTFLVNRFESPRMLTLATGSTSVHDRLGSGRVAGVRSPRDQGQVNG